MDELTGINAETLIARVLTRPESARFETKRVSGKMVSKAEAHGKGDATL